MEATNPLAPRVSASPELTMNRQMSLGLSNQTKCLKCYHWLVYWSASFTPGLFKVDSLTWVPFSRIRALTTYHRNASAGHESQVCGYSSYAELKKGETWCRASGTTCNCSYTIRRFRGTHRWPPHKPIPGHPILRGHVSLLKATWRFWKAANAQHFENGEKLL